MIRDTVRAMSMSVPAGQTLSMRCPSCGRSDNKFYITRENGLIKWVCLRASCNTKGIMSDNPNNPHEVLAKKITTRPHTRPTTTLPTEARKFLESKFNIDPPEYWLWDAERRRVVMPILNADGYTTGTLTRGYAELGSSIMERKALVYWDTDRLEQRLHVERLDWGSTVFVAEDMMSSYVIGQYANSIALLGTNINRAVAHYLRRYGVRRLVFYLDEDATAKGIKMAESCNLLFPEGCTAIPCIDGLDPKDTPHNQLQPYLQEFENGS